MSKYSYSRRNIMKNLPSESLRNAVNAYIKTPTEKNRAKLAAAMEEYKELWITARVSGGTSKSGNRTASTSYSQEMKATREIDGIAVALALQKRTTKETDGSSWWVLSWRTKYSPNGTNRRFYFTKNGIWTIPATEALEMMEELESRGAMGQKYLDRRAEPVCDTRVFRPGWLPRRKNMNWPALRVLKKTGAPIPSSWSIQIRTMIGKKS